RPVESAQYTSAEYAEVARLMQVRLSAGRTGVLGQRGRGGVFRFAEERDVPSSAIRYSRKGTAGGCGVYRGVLQPVSIRRLGSHPILPFGASDIAVGGHQRRRWEPPRIVRSQIVFCQLISSQKRGLMQG